MMMLSLGPEASNSSVSLSLNAYLFIQGAVPYGFSAGVWSRCVEIRRTGTVEEAGGLEAKGELGV
jgi:hypothetical protein